MGNRRALKNFIFLFGVFCFCESFALCEELVAPDYYCLTNQDTEESQAQLFNQSEGYNSNEPDPTKRAACSESHQCKLQEKDSKCYVLNYQLLEISAVRNCLKRKSNGEQLNGSAVLVVAFDTKIPPAPILRQKCTPNSEDPNTALPKNCSDYAHTHRGIIQ